MLFYPWGVFRRVGEGVAGGEGDISGFGVTATYVVCVFAASVWVWGYVSLYGQDFLVCCGSEWGGGV